MNLYVHFPFCRRKCTYCALHSRVGSPSAERANYCEAIAKAITRLPRTEFSTIYFGGGSPAQCDLTPIFTALKPNISATTEFSVELHPLDVTDATLATLRSGGVNRISMGVQSLDDTTLAHMGRGYAAADAERAFAQIKAFFDNAGIDLIVGYPGDASDYSRLAEWDLAHCSVYSLILEEKSILAHLLKNGKLPFPMPADDTTMDKIREISHLLASLGLNRYEISNYARPGHECRHNLAVWRGEDYFGLGEGAHGRMDCLRTHNWWGDGIPAPLGPECETETVSREFDETERRIFRLRTREGIDTTGHTSWAQSLDRAVGEGLAEKQGPVYRLTERGMEVCDAILADLF